VLANLLARRTAPRETSGSSRADGRAGHGHLVGTAIIISTRTAQRQSTAAESLKTVTSMPSRPTGPCRRDTLLDRRGDESVRKQSY